MKKITKGELPEMGYGEIKERLEGIMNSIEKGKIEMESLEEVLEEAGMLVNKCFEKINKAEKISKKWLDQLGA